MDKYEVVGGIREQMGPIYVPSAMKRGPSRWNVVVDIIGVTEIKS